MKYVFDPDLSTVIATDEAPPPPPPQPTGPLAPELLEQMLRYWEAANYLTVGQIYLQANPLLKEPLTPEQIKPRLLGHWGTSPGLSLIYVQLNRLIRERDVDAIYLTGPGHGGPAIVAQVYLEGTYSEIYPAISMDEAGMRALFRQFSTPGGIPSHVSVPTPGSIHEGGELGYVLSHAFGAAFDNPDLLVAAVIGDGEAETGPLAGGWQGVSFLNPVRDGAVLPILHLNGYKIANPTVLGRTPDEAVRALIEGHGYEVRFVCGDDPATVFQEFATTLDWAYDTIRAIQTDARTNGFNGQPRWPAIVLRTPKGWTGPAVVDGLPVEGTFRSHQVPLSGVRQNPDHLRQLEAWLRSYCPERNFDQNGKLVPELAQLAPSGDRRMGANPHANGGKLLVDLQLPDPHACEVTVESPGGSWCENTRPFGMYLRDVFSLNAEAKNFRLFSPDELTSNRLGDVLEVENRCWVGTEIDIDDRLSPDGRVMEILSEHNCEGWLEGYNLTGRHGLFATYEAFAMIAASMMVQHSKWLQEARDLPWREPVSSLNILLTSTAWRNDHNGFSHQGPGLIDVMLSKKGTVSRIYLPPDANTLLSIGEHCLQSRNYVNLIVVDKQAHLQYLTLDEAEQHCIDGASTWQWAGNEGDGEPDVVLAAAGDVPTQEILAAAEWLRNHLPDLKVRVVNVVDLMALFPPDTHPHGMSQTRFVDLFTADKPVVFAFHGYQRAIHEVIHGRVNPERFHVRGFNEQGTTTTPFDMVVLNEMSRFHLAALALKWAPRFRQRSDALIAELESDIQQAVAYSREHFEDPPEIANWTWTG
ncbi:MAG TPA: phosphoketolase family protein [Thermomicrobiales bacterium]|nr:phosphoketolase family protein [Thermomicrobiales bacterium]